MSNNIVGNKATLHRYFLAASRNRSLLIKEIAGQREDQPHAMIHMFLWYATLYVVIEGWRSEKLADLRVDWHLLDDRKVALLRRGRNAIFHYNSDYIDDRISDIMREPEFVEWVHGLHDAISQFFLRLAKEDKQLSPGNPRI